MPSINLQSWPEIYTIINASVQFYGDDPALFSDVMMFILPPYSGYLHHFFVTWNDYMVFPRYYFFLVSSKVAWTCVEKTFTYAVNPWSQRPSHRNFIIQKRKKYCIVLYCYYFYWKSRKIYCYCSTRRSQKDRWIVLTREIWRELLFWLSIADKVKLMVDFILKAWGCQSSKVVKYGKHWIWNNVFFKFEYGKFSLKHFLIH